MKFMLMHSVDGRWQWRLDAHDGRSIAQGSHSFATKEEAVASIERLRALCPCEVAVDKVASTNDPPLPD